MTELLALKKQAKKYIDTADEKVVKMVHAMLEVNAQKDWWDEMPAAAKKSVTKGLKEMTEGKLTPHKDVMKKYRKWL